MENKAPQLVTLADIGAMIRISRSKIYDLKSSGQLPRCIKIGRSVRWRLRDIEAWINAGCPSQERFESLRKAGAK
jgi:predicted DNA-binding transcriptional regulator AlpA